jgi:hypothetical protein
LETPLEEIKKKLQEIGFTDSDYSDGVGHPPSVILTPNGAAKANDKHLWIEKAGLHAYPGGRGVPPTIGFSQKTMRKMIAKTKPKK